jgi:hypothetical protein
MSRVSRFVHLSALLLFLLGSHAFAQASFTRSKAATQSYRDELTGCTLWYDPKVWTFKINEDGHPEFDHQGTDLWAFMSVVRGVPEVPEGEQMRYVHENLLQDSEISRIVHDEQRSINGHKVIHVLVEGSDNKNEKYRAAGYIIFTKAGICQVQVVRERAEVLSETEEAEAFKLLDGLDLGSADSGTPKKRG